MAACGLVGGNIYWLWSRGPWDLPNPAKARVSIADQYPKQESKPTPVVSTENIVSKNLFDPERGAGRTREAEASTRAFQRIRSMILLGTAIIGSNRFAILQDPPDVRSGPVTPGGPAGLLRLKLGDNVEGFQLTEIGDRRVVFTKGTARVEVSLDYFRKTAPVEAPLQPTPGQVAPPKPVVPRVIPSLPQRDKLPAPPSQ